MAFDWEAYKKEILYLYLREGLTLERIRQKLIDKYQEFNPSISSYRTKLRQWKALKQQQRQRRAQGGSGASRTPSPRPSSPIAVEPISSPIHADTHNGQFQLESPVVPSLSSGTTPQSQQGLGDIPPTSSSMITQQTSPPTPTAAHLGPTPSSSLMLSPEIGARLGSTSGTMSAAAPPDHSLTWPLTNSNDLLSLQDRWAPTAMNGVGFATGSADFDLSDSQYGASGADAPYMDAGSRDTGVVEPGLSSNGFDQPESEPWPWDPSLPVISTNDTLYFHSAFSATKSCTCSFCPFHGSVDSQPSGSTGSSA